MFNPYTIQDDMNVFYYPPANIINAPTPPEDGVIQEELSSEDRKKQLCLERNRQAAYRCRERKKLEQKKLIERADDLTKRNESLNAVVGNLKNEIITLREMLLTHDTCDCDRVRIYVSKFL
ncbi:hypothetical protein BDB01DRAFT_901594 [Pilobolus umbonatus]|nr:hypothetical protein BDB01DRAFT_901594 [Pilobolus umbonatus]